MQPLTKKKLLAVLLLLFLITVGFYTKIYSGVGLEWVNNKLGGVFYEVFWILLFFILLPVVKPIKISAWVLIITCMLEFLQLLDHEILAIIRANFFGQAIIGNSFAWSDFPYYFAGSLLGFLMLRLINNFR
ncbi:MAG: DUF2809 domain-containing protein [Bacteroidales bacterium]